MSKLSKCFVSVDFKKFSPGDKQDNQHFAEGEICKQGPHIKQMAEEAIHSGLEISIPAV